jgi:hypothetical protein
MESRTLAPSLVLVASFLGACGGASALGSDGGADALCECAVDPAPYLEELEAAGESLDRIVDVDELEDLSFVLDGEMYRYVILPDGRFRVAPVPRSAENNAWVHPVLGEGEPVRGAGFLRRDDGGARWTIDRDSQAYCPPPGSETWAVEALLRLGISRDGIGVVQVDPECVRDRAPIAPRRDLIVR